MSDPVKNPFDLLVDQIRAAVRQEIDILRSELNSKAALSAKDWLKAEQAEQLYGLPKTWFEEKGRAGDIARTKPGRYTLFQRRDIEAYLERNKATDWPKRRKKKRDEGLTSG